MTPEEEGRPVRPQQFPEFPDRSLPRLFGDEDAVHGAGGGVDGVGEAEIGRAHV